MTTYNLEHLVSVSVRKAFPCITWEYKKPVKLFGRIIQKEFYKGWLYSQRTPKQMEEAVKDSDGELMIAENKEVYTTPRVILKFSNGETFVKTFESYLGAKTWGEGISESHIKKPMK